MRRRSFLAVAGAAAVFPRVALAQQPKVPRVALLTNFPIAEPNSVAGVAAFNSVANISVFLTEFARLGFIEGRTVTFDRYSALPADSDLAARTIVASKPDMVVVSAATFGALALMALTTTIPIVFGNADPISSGVVSTLAPTNRNLAVVAGTASSDYEGKTLGLLAEAVPTARRAAYIFADLSGPLSPSRENNVRVVRDAAARLGVSLTVIVAAEIGDEQAFREAFEKARSANIDMIQFGRNSPVANGSAFLARMALEYRIPAISNYHPFSRAGGLMSYGQADGDQYKQVAGYAALILKGTDPGTLPVLQPQTFDLIVNLNTARALGVKIAPTIVAQATQVIE